MEGYNISVLYDGEGCKAQVRNSNGDRLPEFDARKGEQELVYGLVARVLSSIEDELGVQVVSVVPRPTPVQIKPGYARHAGDTIEATFWVLARPNL